MSTANTVKAQIQRLISDANAATGRTDTDLTSAVAALIASISPVGPVVLFSYDFSKLTGIPAEFDIEHQELASVSDGALILNAGDNSGGSVSNAIQMDGFESRHARIDWWSTYSTNPKSWNCEVAYGFGCWWDADIGSEIGDNIGIHSIITGEYDIMEQGMPAGSDYTQAANNVYCGSKFGTIEVYDVEGGFNCNPGVEHKHTLLLNGNTVQFLVDDVIQREFDVSAYDEMPITSEFLYERNALTLLPRWLRFGTGAKQGDYTAGSVFYKLRKMEITSLEDGNVNPTSLTVSNDYIDGSVPVGCKLFMIREFTPSNVSNEYCTWSSSDETVATVNRCGVVRTLKEGNCIITATTINGVSASYPMTVSNSATVRARKIDVGALSESINLLEGETANIMDGLTIYPSYYTGTLFFSSDNEDVCTVESDGTLTGVGTGSCNITVEIDGMSASFPVTCASAGSMLYSGALSSTATSTGVTYDLNNACTVVLKLNISAAYIAGCGLHTGSARGVPRLTQRTSDLTLVWGGNSNYTGDVILGEHIVAFTNDGDKNICVYLDGTLVASGTRTTNWTSGELYTQTGNNAPGTIEIYNYAMTAEQVAALTA